VRQQVVQTSAVIEEDVFQEAAAHADYWREWSNRRRETHEPTRKQVVSKAVLRVVKLALVVLIGVLIGMFLMNFSVTAKF
jgi:hypothetical protein